MVVEDAMDCDVRSPFNGGKAKLGEVSCYSTQWLATLNQDSVCHPMCIVSLKGRGSGPCLHKAVQVYTLLPSRRKPCHAILSGLPSFQSERDMEAILHRFTWRA